MHAKILIVDDETDIRMSLENRVTWMGHEPLIATDVASALRLIREEEPDLVLLDMKLGQESGLEVLHRVRETSDLNQSRGEGNPKTSGTYTTPLIVILTAFGTIELAVQAMQHGAFDFVPKPFTADHLTVVITKALDTVTRYNQVNRLRKEVEDTLDPLVTASDQMIEQRDRAKKAAASKASVLILGETGTGKGILAQTIHRWSPRFNKPFIAINCASIPETLIEAELFGHEKHVFTDAKSMKRGLFEEADGGTLFLDEIGDMSLSTQAKILRALDEPQTIKRVGGTKQIKVDVRVLAATNKDLQLAVRKGSFREDLFFRLAVITTTLPPLRERMDDLLALAQHFVISRPGKLGLNKCYKLSELAIEALQGYSWPGNIRELDNVISRALVLCTGDIIEPEDILLPDALSSTKELGNDASADVACHSYHENITAYSRKLIEEALRRNGWNQTKTALYLGLQRTYLTKLIRKFQILGKPPTFSD